MNITVEEIKLKGIKIERGSLEESFDLDLLQGQIIKDLQNPMTQKIISNGVYNCLNFKNVEDVNWVTFKEIWYYPLSARLVIPSMLQVFRLVRRNRFC